MSPITITEIKPTAKTDKCTKHQFIHLLRQHWRTRTSKTAKITKGDIALITL